jgi:RimJ/RimL family protein N-acetyltransferase
MLHNLRPRKPRPRREWAGNDTLNLDLEIRFPVAERYLRDSQMPDTQRYNPEYAWAVMGPSTTLLGCAGVFDFGWFLEFGSLWVHPSIRGQGWARKLTEARIKYLKTNRDRFPNLLISRPNNQASRHTLAAVGFKPTGIDDGEGDIIYIAYLKGL